MVYHSPCEPCEYSFVELGEFGDPIHEECSKPEGGYCWLEYYDEQSDIMMNKVVSK